MIVHLFNNRLKDLEAALQEDDPQASIDAFTLFLEALEAERASHERDAWVLRAAEIRRHDVFSILRRCPMTRHSLDKPRGYPGDAALLDWIYFPEKREPTIEDPVGRYLFHHNVRRTSPSAVRSRIKYVAEMIDAVPAGGSVLALACGHFREAEFSQAIREGRLSHIDVVDQDPRSIKIVRDQKIPNLTAREGNVMRFPRATKDSPKYYLIYAVGLFDYFSPRMAQRVANRLWSHVAPGGVLCIPNFNRNIPDAGYLECFMDWWLVYRDRKDMDVIADALPADSVADVNMDLRDHDNIWYLQARRKVASPKRAGIRIDPKHSGVVMPKDDTTERSSSDTT